MDKKKLKTILIQTAINYFKSYNLTSQDIMIINGYIQELFAIFGIDED